MSTKTETQKSASAVKTQAKGFSDQEKAAMKARTQELKAEARAQNERAEGEKAVAEAIAAMKEPDRAMAKRVDALVRASVPALAPKTWYGMPAYAKDGNLICFFKSAQKFSTRYATLGFSDKAKLDDGDMWPSEFALMALTPATEARISALVKKAVG